MERRQPRLHRATSLLEVDFITFFICIFFVFSIFLKFQTQNPCSKKAASVCLMRGREQVLVFLLVFLFLFFFNCDKDLSTQSLDAVFVPCRERKKQQFGDVCDV